ncbi:MAG: SDR family oxidoreductase [Candidatus Hydrogenedentota bacterium]
MPAGLLELAGKTALITGAAKRMGRATARALAGAGVHCVLHYRSSAEACAAVAADVCAAGGNAWMVQGDFADPSAAARTFDKAKEAAGTIDILVNNASVFPDSTLMNCEPEDVHHNLNVNTLTPFLLARELAAQERDAVVVNFLDAMIADYDRKHVAYHLSKRALYSLTRMMAVEFAPRLRVNAVAPGLVLPPAGKDESYLASLAHTNPLETCGSLETITEAVLFLVRNSFITGQVIYVDGGRNLRGAMYG